MNASRSQLDGWLAWPSSGALMVGALLTLAFVVGDLFMRRAPRT
jgi:hypothetical protein